MRTYCIALQHLLWGPEWEGNPRGDVVYTWLILLPIQQKRNQTL